MSEEEIVLKRLKDTLAVLTGKNVITNLDFQIRNMVEDCIKVIEKQQATIKNSVSKDRIRKDLETCEKVYKEEMKPYQREYGLDVTYLSKKEKEKLINTRNCLIAQMETYKQLLEDK